MFKNHIVFTLAFNLIFILNIFSQSSFFQDFNIFIKPLICIALAFYLFRKVNMAAGFNRLVFAGLICSLFGDCFLLFASSDIYFFLYGLVSFLLAHVLYSFAFYRDFKNNPQASKFYGHVMLFILGVFTLSFYSFIRDYLNDFRIPVMVYMFVISVMAILAAYRYKRVNLLSFRLILFGAVFFVISDAALAFNKFVEPYSFAGILIMSTYMIAQYLITMGAIERKVEGMK
ncbi:lysoplasmalogenase [Daejeonella sp.]|uniref:lysoplasmalogenase n=1 Tax=Daejeonella sp. TaxID=2805397 RepID=UPI0025BBE1BE|nr:lysoplasmalogenase [Daejeonella sp.]